MACEYCHWTSGHPSSCPNADEPVSNHKCKFCKEYIFIGEECIENENGEYVHWECVDYARDLLKFLGYEVKEMED